MAPRAQEKQYSQARRDAETAAVEEAQALIPPKYLEAVEAAADGRYNPTTKLLKGVIAYLNEMGSGASVQSMQQHSNSPVRADSSPPLLCSQ